VLISLVNLRKARKEMSLRKVMQKQSKQTIVEAKFIEMALIIADIVCDAVGGTTA